jgi:hypothetical protein
MIIRRRTYDPFPSRKKSNDRAKRSLAGSFREVNGIQLPRANHGYIGGFSRQPVYAG